MLGGYVLFFIRHYEYVAFAYFKRSQRERSSKMLLGSQASEGMNRVAPEGASSVLSLLRTCRQVYVEARMLPFALNEVRCDQRWQAENWAESHPLQAQAVTVIRHYCKIFWNFPYPLTACSVFEGYGNLQHLYINTTFRPADRTRTEDEVSGLLETLCPRAKVSFLYH